MLPYGMWFYQSFDTPEGYSEAGTVACITNGMDKDFMIKDFTPEQKPMCD